MAKDKDESQRKKGTHKGKTEGPGSARKEESVTVLAHAISAWLATILLNTRLRATPPPQIPKTRDVDQGFVAEDDSTDDDYEESEGHDSGDDDYYDGTDADTTAPLAIDRLHGNLLNMIHSFVRADRLELASAVRKLWLEHLTANPELVFQSACIRKVVELYKQVRKDHPDLKMCVSSQYLRILDMIKVATREECGVEGLKCNGVLPEAIRQGNPDTFKDNADSDIPLLLSGKAGGEGIDLPQASIMIQTEEWWNRNSENQLNTGSRVHRPGQKYQYQVILIRLQANSCSIGEYIINTQMRKQTINTVLMRPLTRSHDEPAKTPELHHKPPLLTAFY